MAEDVNEPVGATEEMKGAFMSSLVRSNSKIRKDRALAIAEAAEMIYKREVEDLGVRIQKLRDEARTAKDAIDACGVRLTELEEKCDSLKDAVKALVLSNRMLTLVASGKMTQIEFSNLTDMLLSIDIENHHVALEAISNLENNGRKT